MKVIGAEKIGWLIAGVILSVYSLSSVASATTNETFNAVCPASTSCAYSGAAEGKTYSMSCKSGTLTVNSATYGASTKTESCLTYAANTCNGKASCSVTFNNTNCVKDPDVGVVKSASAVVTCATASTTGVTAVPANTFLNSLGINTHISQGYSSTAYIPLLKYLGVRQIRDSISNLSDSITVHQQTGVKLTVNAAGDLTDLLSAGRTLAAAGALLALEGPNEPNNFPITYNGATGGGQSTWVPVADFQSALYSQAKADSVLKNYAVFSPSEVGGEVNNVGLQFLTIPSGSGALLAAGTKFSDYVNVHNYVSSTNSKLYVDNQAWSAASPTLNSSWDGLETEQGTTWYGHFAGYTAAQLPGVARVTTETGWDSVSNPGGTTVQGKVLLNTYFSQYKEGWAYTFIYELVDGQGSSGSQGVFTSAYADKPAATYIHNMTTILADTTSSSSPGKLNYSIANEPTTVHDLLLQKSSGTFELAVWGESVSATNNITVNLGGTHATVHVYDPTVSSAVKTTYTNVSSVPLSMTDHLMIVEVIN